MHHLQRGTEGKATAWQKTRQQKKKKKNEQENKLTDGGANERWGVTDVVQAFLLDEVGDGRGEVLVVCFNIVLQDQTAQRASGLIWSGEGKRKEEKKNLSYQQGV